MSWNETVDRFTKLKEEERSITSKLDRAKGALSSHRKTLREKFKCDSVKEAKELLAKIRKQNDERAAGVEKLLTEIEEAVSDRQRD